MTGTDMGHDHISGRVTCYVLGMHETFSPHLLPGVPAWYPLVPTSQGRPGCLALPPLDLGAAQYGGAWAAASSGVFTDLMRHSGSPMGCGQRSAAAGIAPNGTWSYLNPQLITWRPDGYPAVVADGDAAYPPLESAPGRQLLDLLPGRGNGTGLRLRLVASAASDPLTARQALLAVGIPLLRLTAWMRAGTDPNSPRTAPRDWATRTTLAHASQLLVGLANAVNASVWLSLPRAAAADDAYVAGMYRFPNPRIFATPPPPASSSVLHADVAYHRVRQQLAARGLGLLGYAAGPELTGPSYGARANYDRVLQACGGSTPTWPCTFTGPYPPWGVYAPEECRTPSLLAAANATPAACNPAVGINLEGISDWSRAWTFVDVFKAARDWIHQSLTPGPWSLAPPLPVISSPDGPGGAAALGYPAAPLPPDSRASTLAWSRTNDADQPTSWPQRPTPDTAWSYAAAPGGVPLELQLLLANTLGAQPWLCLPAAADDDYVAGMAAAVAAGLRPDVGVVVELGNELWHTGFPGGQRPEQRGPSVLGGAPHRQHQPHAVWPLTTAKLLSCGGPAVTELIDAVAIAPYFGAYDPARDTNLTTFMTVTLPAQANRHPAMSGLYSRYLSGLVSAGVSRIVHFSSLGAASRFGSWGLAEWQDQDPATAPKQQALLSFLHDNLHGEACGEATYTEVYDCGYRCTFDQGVCNTTSVSVSGSGSIRTWSCACGGPPGLIGGRHCSIVSCPNDCSWNGDGCAPGTACVGPGECGCADTTEWVWTDLMKGSSGWMTANTPDTAAENPFDTGAALELWPGSGYPARLPPNTYAHVLLQRDLQLHAWPGRHVLLHEGEGRLDLGMDATVVSRWEGSLARYRVLRFMTWQATNTADWAPADGRTAAASTYSGPGATQWGARVTPDFHTQAVSSLGGVAAEHVAQLANLLGADVWLAAHHTAANDTVAAAAGLLAARLRPDVAVYVEHSNEVWNPLFPAYGYAVDRGRALGLAPPSAPNTTAAYRYHALRTMQIGEIFKAAFASAPGGGSGRVRVVLGGWGYLCDGGAGCGRVDYYGVAAYWDCGGLGGNGPADVLLSVEQMIASQYGSWGLQEYTGQPVAEAHKYRALMDWLDEQGLTAPVRWATVGFPTTNTSASNPTSSTLDITLWRESDCVPAAAQRPSSQALLVLASGLSAAAAASGRLDQGVPGDTRCSFNADTGCRTFRTSNTGMWAWSVFKPLNWGAADCDPTAPFPACGEGELCVAVVGCSQWGCDAAAAAQGSLTQRPCVGLCRPLALGPLAARLTPDGRAGRSRWTHVTPEVQALEEGLEYRIQVDVSLAVVGSEPVAALSLSGWGSGGDVWDNVTLALDAAAGSYDPDLLLGSSNTGSSSSARAGLSYSWSCLREDLAPCFDAGGGGAGGSFSADGGVWSVPPGLLAAGKSHTFTVTTETWWWVLLRLLPPHDTAATAAAVNVSWSSPDLAVAAAVASLGPSTAAAAGDPATQLLTVPAAALPAGRSSLTLVASLMLAQPQQGALSGTASLTVPLNSAPYCGRDRAAPAQCLALALTGSFPTAAAALRAQDWVDDAAYDAAAPAPDTELAAAAALRYEFGLIRRTATTTAATAAGASTVRQLYETAALVSAILGTGSSVTDSNDNSSTTAAALLLADADEARQMVSALAALAAAAASLLPDSAKEPLMMAARAAMAALTSYSSSSSSVSSAGSQLLLSAGPEAVEAAAAAAQGGSSSMGRHRRLATGAGGYSLSLTYAPSASAAVASVVAAAASAAGLAPVTPLGGLAVRPPQRQPGRSGAAGGFGRRRRHHTAAVRLGAL
eukprot:XP_001698904.1 predicted protein [Chlamydomonas reinhardtii]